jgi:hypothetical protein
MNKDSTSTNPKPTDPVDDPEAVFVDPPAFSEDDETFEAEDEPSDCAYDEDEEEQEDFVDEEDEMSLTRIGLHDLNTLRHLYRFGLLNVNRSMLTLSSQSRSRT